MNSWAELMIAIMTEVAATTALKASAGFSKPGPSVIVIVGYGLSFYFLSLALQTISVGVAYAVWSGIGVTLITLAAWLVYDQRLDPPALIGMTLIVCGVGIMNLFSKAVLH